MTQKLKMRLAAIPAFVLAGTGSAMAALPQEVTQGITDAGADLKSAATAVIVALIAFWALRAIGKKMGWWA